MHPRAHLVGAHPEWAASLPLLASTSLMGKTALLPFSVWRLGQAMILLLIV